MNDFFENVLHWISLPFRAAVHFWYISIWLAIFGCLWGTAEFLRWNDKHQERVRICSYLVQEHCVNVGRTLDNYSKSYVRQWWRCPTMTRDFSIDEDLCKDFDIKESK